MPLEIKHAYPPFALIIQRVFCATSGARLLVRSHFEPDIFPARKFVERNLDIQRVRILFRIRCIHQKMPVEIAFIISSCGYPETHAQESIYGDDGIDRVRCPAQLPNITCDEDQCPECWKPDLDGRLQDRISLLIHFFRLSYC